jgi:DNA adenine methylase
MCLRDKNMRYKVKTKKHRLVKESNCDYSVKSENINKVAPFLKWVGGKKQLISQFKKYFLNDFNKYIEPFVGGGAVFFHLYNLGKLRDKEVILIDSNKDLINCYQVIQNNVEKLIICLLNGKYINDEKIYYKIREERPVNNIDRAARIIYLNKTCLNGLYRVNSKGDFNVPYGYYKNPNICDVVNLRNVSKALKKVKLVAGDFEKCMEYSEINDFVYFDPPYHPISKTSSFTNYTSNAFDESDQERLAEVLKELDKRKCHVMLSNSDNLYIKKLYNKFSTEIVKARRAINCIGNKRGQINELVIFNY